jgi:hypothetical protein
VPLKDRLRCMADAVVVKLLDFLELKPGFGFQTSAGIDDCSILIKDCVDLLDPTDRRTPVKPEKERIHGVSQYPVKDLAQLPALNF